MCGSVRLLLWPLRGVTYEDEELVTYMSLGRGFSRKVCNPVMYIIVTHRNYSALLSIDGIAYLEGGVSAVTEFGEVWGI